MNHITIKTSAIMSLSILISGCSQQVDIRCIDRPAPSPIKIVTKEWCERYSILNTKYDKINKSKISVYRVDDNMSEVRGLSFKSLNDITSKSTKLIRYNELKDKEIQYYKGVISKHNIECVEK